MPITISGSTGIAGVDGSAGTPALQGTDTNTGISFPAADTIAFNEGGAEVMRINSSGNVGIGTSSPDALLTINTVASFGDGSASAPSIAHKGDLNTGAWFPAADTLAFSTGGSERARIDSSGNLLIGTTTASGAKLRVNGVSLFDGLIYATGVYNQTTAQAANMHIAADANIFRSTSSRKYKRDINDAPYGLPDLMALRPVTYKGLSESDGESVFGGLIAEEVHDAGLTEFVQYAADGSPDALAYGNMVSLCIKAIQEQQSIIEDLKARVTALEAK